jgi:hypothetical protein
MSPKAIIIGIIIFFLAVCACAVGIVLIAGGFLAYQTGALAPPEPTLSPAEIDARIEEIEAFVIVNRGLEPEGLVDLTFLTTQEVLDRTRQDFEEDTTPEEMADDALVLDAFGLMDADVDLYELLIRLYSEGVAGFFDPDTHEMVVVSDGGFNAYERTVFAHEYTHALQDQVFGIRASGFSDEMWEADPERFNAIQAVLEGDASLLEEQFLDTYSATERAQYNREVNSVDVAIYFELPPFLLQDFIFPYREGLEFVRRYYDDGGWPAVDALWANPPVSTEHILHPERYEAGDPPVIVARPALTDTLGSGWRLLDSNVNGEWYTYLLLAYGADASAQLPDSRARLAAEGWGGDGYVVHYHDADKATVMAAEWVWDTTDDANEFALAFEDYANARFGADSATSIVASARCWQTAGLTCLFLTGDRTLWLAAPDEATLTTVLEQYPAFQP